MNTERMGEGAIFQQACDIEASADREAYVREACGDDEQLRRRVFRLLELHAQCPSFLEEPAVGALDATVRVAEVERPGTSIGPYKLLERIGQGGFGFVYMAEQIEPVRRKVALKVIKPGMDTNEVIARFEAERQALAIMEHPNIAKVLDAGATDSGKPYFVMELVRGVPITTFCDQNNMTMRDRLELFTSVCHAVQHAHQKGIIHRDIKPTNVLVTLRDHHPIAKVIDFGVAKAINQRLTEKTVFTRFAQMIGTPLYMSPEQAGMNELDVDTRSDIYSLGVLLYEILTGVTPFDKQRLREAAFDELRRIIREEEPPRPSFRISSLGETLPSVAAQRQTEPRKLSALFRGELDWVLMKALEKDRTRRYETASAFATDIERYLRNEPVEACPPSRLYRFRKFAQKNRIAIITGAVVTLSLLLGMIGTTWQMVRAVDAEVAAREQYHAAESARHREAQQRLLAEERRSDAEEQSRCARAAEEKAKKEEAIAKAVVEFMTDDIFAQAQPDIAKNRDITLRTVVDRASDQIQGRFDAQPLVEATIRSVLGNIYRQLGLYDTAEQHLRRVVELLEDGASDESQVFRLEVQSQLAGALFYQGDYREAALLDQEVLEGRRRLLGDDHPDTLASKQNLAALCSQFGRMLEAEQLYREVSDTFVLLVGIAGCRFASRILVGI